MVLPGISGSFILVILGSYAWILSAVKQFEWLTLGLFSLGCFVGLLSIANVLSWAFERFRETTLALLTGFMIGALNKVWPWREVVSYRENSQGDAVPLIEELVLPHAYQIATGKDAQVEFAILCFVLSAALVFSLSYCLKTVKK
jgi:putative membrane protein